MAGAAGERGVEVTTAHSQAPFPRSPRARKVATAPVDANEVMASLVPESQLQRDVMECFQRFGYLTFHVYDSRLTNNGSQGFPDMVAIGCGRTIFAELKTQRGKRSPEQLIWASAIRETTAEYYVWRPIDWRKGTIERIVRGGVA